MGRRCLILALTALLLTGCAGSPGQSAATLAPAESDRVVIYTSHKEEVYGPIVKEFEARTGIWAEVVTGGTNELLARIAGEADAPVCDVIFGGGVESLTAYERYFQPYACAEADLIRPGLRPADDLWTPFSSLPVVLIYNTKLVSPGELTGWESLLSGRWSGSIALADPAVSGSSYTAAATMLCALPGDDWDQLDRLAVQLEGRVLPDSGDVVAAVAGGSCRVGVTLEETALKRQAQGADIAIVYPEEGTSAVPDGSALIAGAPHPDNARAFLDFAQSRDVQELVVSQFSRRSVRTDVSDGDALAPCGRAGAHRLSRPLGGGAEGRLLRPLAGASAGGGAVMKNASFRQKLLTSFLAIGILPLLICTLLMLNIFRLSLTRSAADAAETQLDAMSGELSGLLSDCETVMEKLCAEPAVAAALDRSELDEQRVYSVLYRAAAPVLGGASLSVYGADGRQLYSTSSQPASGSLSPRWGLLAAAADGAVVYRGASSKSSACIQAACAVRRGSVPLGYVVADVTAAQLTALFDGQYTATSRLLLLDPFWDQVYASSDLPAKTLAARLRSQLLAGQALSDSHGAYDYFVRQEPRSGFCLVLQQPKPMTEGTAELMYLVAGLSLLLCLGLCVLASMRVSRQLFEPIRALNSAMREVEEGNLNVQLDNRRIDEMGQLSGRFNRMAQRLRQNLKDSLRQQRELNEAQIRMMQAQLNPHFLYNTLDTIKWMGKIHQAPEIATISADLADILRSSISADELVPLRQELRLVERYVEIQNIRFSGAFALTVEVDEPLRDVPVPKLMLQPLVENAILHGFRDRSGGEIRISAYRAEEDLILTVRDNGCGVPEEVLAQYRDGAPRPGGHFGLHNVDAILRIRYGPDRGVRFVPVQGEGACIRITLPVFRKGEEPPC